MDSSIFFKNLSDRFILAASHQFTVLISIIILGLRLDLHNFGIISTYLVLFQISYLLTEWGYSIYSLHIVNNKKENILKDIYFIVFFSKLIFLIFCIIFILVFFYFSDTVKLNIISIIFLTFSVSFAAFNPLWYLQAISRTDILIKSTIISRLVFLSIVFFFVNNDNIEYFFLAQAITFFLPTLFGNHFIIKNYKPKINFNFKKLLLIKKKTFGIFVSTLIQNQAFSIWGLFLLFNSNPINLAYFALADQILRAGNGVGNIFQEIFMSIKNKVKKNIYYRNFFIIIFSSFLLTILAIFFTEKLIFFIFATKFLGAVEVIKLIIISWFFLTITKVISYPFVNQFSQIKLINNISYVVLLFNIFLIFINFIFMEINILNTGILFLIAVILNLILNLVHFFKINKNFFFSNF